MEINNQWIDSVKYRTSRRTYIDEPLKRKDINKVKELISRINEESGLNFKFIEDCSKLFKGFSASYGMIKGLNSCIALVGNTNIDNYKTKSGYYGEVLVLEATRMNLGTCWIGGTYDKKECKKYIDINQDEEIICVIAVGEVLKDKSTREKLISKMSKGKKTVDEILLERDVELLPNWIKEGVSFATKAPSALNKQPVRYSFSQNLVKAYTISDKYGYEDIDLGISMLHFELGAKSQSYNGNWNYINGEKVYNLLEK